MTGFRTLPAIALLALALLPAPAGADIVAEVRDVNTTVAFGTAFGDIFPDMDGVRAGTDLSGELVAGIVGTVSDGRLVPALADTYGILDNLGFLLGPLTPYGNAGDQLATAFDSHFAGLDALIGGVGTWTVNTVHVLQEQYSLAGGLVDASDNPVADQAYCDTNDCRFIVGTATVDFYEVTGEFDAHGADLPVPEPAALAMFAVGLAGLGAARRHGRRKRP